jgi:hypothetical protein
MINQIKVMKKICREPFLFLSGGDLQTRISLLAIDMKKKLNHTPAFGKTGRWFLAQNSNLKQKRRLT